MRRRPCFEGAVPAVESISRQRLTARPRSNRFKRYPSQSSGQQRLEPGCWGGQCVHVRPGTRVYQQFREADVARNGVAAADAAGGNEASFAVEVKQQETVLVDVAAHDADRGRRQTRNLQAKIV